MEENTFIKAQNIKKVIDRTSFILKSIGSYNLQTEDKLKLANELTDLYKSSYNPDFKIKLSECFKDILYTAKSDFEEI